MPHFYRNSRQLLRLFLILVLAMGFFGWWYATRNWQINADTLDFSAVTADLDWLELTAGLIEASIEIFQNAVSR
jgi:TRAP-type C4-dicarboxylate transport system permease small subunit